ncbi:glycoside hydrolase family 18 protein [Mycena sanguinolenta]|nr:glycoside hydrolase family 18 protein [Mycena sanguinolenta]
MFKFSSSVFSALVFCAVAASAFDHSRSDNVRQNSYGDTHGSDMPNWQQTIGDYCKDTCIDVIPIAFVDSFSGGVPDLNLGNTCDDNGSTGNCATLAAGIEACQAMGKIVTLSLGGESLTTGFASDTDAINFATTIWNRFLGGSGGGHRPFGSAVLDGVDLDIESGTNTGYAAFATQIRSLWAGASKPYYLSAAPQCFFPDAWVGSALDTACKRHWLRNTSSSNSFDIITGAPASPTAANPGEYVPASTLGTIASASLALDPTRFGGMMLW